MEQSKIDDPQGTATPLRGQRVSGCSDCPPSKAGQPGGSPVEVPVTPGRAGPINMTARELLIYQAGQSFGAAQALKQTAQAANKLSQDLATQAAAQKVAGDALLDRAFKRPQDGDGTPSGDAGARLGRRVVKALSALLGE